MKNYIFTKTDSGDRTNIMSEFPLWNKEMFLENVKLGNSSGRYRYGQIGGMITMYLKLSVVGTVVLYTPFN